MRRAQCSIVHSKRAIRRDDAMRERILRKRRDAEGEAGFYKAWKRIFAPF
jgi:hypothetical protein